MPRSRPENLCIDQIPVGDGYGVQKEEEPARLNYLTPLDAWPISAQTRTIWWLIRFTGRKWVHVRQLPPDAVVSFDCDGTHYVYGPWL